MEWENEFRIKLRHQVGYLALGGRTDFSLLPTVKEAISFILDKGTRYLVIDLNDISYADSSFFSLLVQLDGQLKERNGKLYICVDNPRIVRVLGITTLPNILDIRPDLEEILSEIEECLSGKQTPRKQPA